MRRYYDISVMRGQILLKFGLIRKLICGLHKKNAFKFRKYCMRDEILMK